EASLRITHPNVVQVRDSGLTPQGALYLVQEYIKGESLEKLLKNSTRLAFQDVLKIVNQIAEALEAAHSEGIVHRDLKPSNVMIQDLSGGGKLVKVIDFGIAKVDQSAVGNTLTATGMFIGTPLYASPEQLRGELPSFQMDLWALAVMTYQMITGELPFFENTWYLLEVKQRAGPLPPKQRRAELPDAAQQVILKALSYEPVDRFASVREYCSALNMALSQPVVISPSIYELPTQLVKNQDTNPIKGKITSDSPLTEPTQPNINPVIDQTNKRPYRSLFLVGALLLIIVSTLSYYFIEKSLYKPPVKPVAASLTYRLLIDNGKDQPYYSSGKEIFQAGNRFKILLKPNSDSYLYILNEDVDGKLSLLFPATHLNNGTAIIKKDLEISLPNEWFVFDNKVGSDQLILIVAYQPVELFQQASYGPINNALLGNEIRKWINSQTLSTLENNDNVATFHSTTQPLVARILLRHY
ncbi:MAG: protein kinase, partial [Acidobacteriota bacterium]